MATIKYWDGSAWQYAVVGKQGPVGPTGPTGPAGQASLQRFRYVATGGQTSVSGTDANGNTLAYTPGLEEVFINGAAQVRGQDYTATNGTSITGITALIAGDVVEIYAWGVFNVANTISNTLIDAKGDILAGTGADSVGRLAVGANNTVLTADSSTATGLRWAAPAAGGRNFIFLNGPSGTSLSGATEVTISGIGGYDEYFIVWQDVSAVNANAYIGFRFNNDSGANYNFYGSYSLYNSAYASGNFEGMGGTGAGQAGTFGRMSNSASSVIHGYLSILGTNTAGVKVWQGHGNGTNAGTGGQVAEFLGGVWNNTATISSIVVRSSNGNFDNGSVRIYGSV